MEVREILIANTRTQKRSKITTAATTLGELKAALTEAGIDYSDMTFTEGISKTQLLGDDTQLPQNVMYKGSPTNNLVILLTNTKKKIASGATMSRAEAYALIKKRGLQEDIKSHFGRNFTRVSTTDLKQFLNSTTDDNDDNTTSDVARSFKTENTPQTEKHVEAEEHVEVEKENNEDPKVMPTDFIDRFNSLICAFNTLVNVLYENGDLYDRDLENVRVATPEEYKFKSDDNNNTSASSSISTSDGQINDDDIDKMLNELNM